MEWTTGRSGYVDTSKLDAWIGKNEANAIAH